METKIRRVRGSRRERGLFLSSFNNALTNIIKWMILNDKLHVCGKKQSWPMLKYYGTVAWRA